MARSSRRDRILRVAREAFGYDELRPGQLEAIEAVLDGRDTLAILSTGAGKSAIYQIAGLLIDGATIVVSPLIALQRDQVEALQEHAQHGSAGRTDGPAGEPARGLGAARLNSTIRRSEREEALAELAEDALEFLFLAPEQLSNQKLLDELAVARPSLLVVDEAHCISEWGHDFRPEYLRLGAAAEALGDPTILALTATAAPPVREEIVERLRLADPAVIVRGFDRPNVRLSVDRFYDERPLRRALVERVVAAPKPGIVYAATRKGAESIVEELMEAGVNAAAYHAGLRGARREEVQEALMQDELDCVVATTAFGMGVDKGNVRWVFHSAPADSVDSFFQELGRCGRDSEPAESVLFYRQEDLGLRRFFSGSGQVGEEELDKVAFLLEVAGRPVEPTELQHESRLSQSKLTTAVSRLEDAGAVEVLPSGEVAESKDAPEREAAVAEALEIEDHRRSFDRSRIEMMRRYAETDGCRRAFLLAYFGEPFEPPCGNCDNCSAGRTEAPPGDVPFTLGARVRHREWGEGVVQRYADDAVSVLFDDVGYKTLALDVVVERELLEPV